MQMINGLGETKEITHYYLSGDGDCPFCFSPIMLTSGETKCKNPACETNLSARTILEIREKESRRKLEEERRKQNYEWAMERIEQEREAENKWRSEQIAIAKEKGYCLKCLFQSGYHRVKYIKHRKGCNK